MSALTGIGYWQALYRAAEDRAARHAAELYELRQAMARQALYCLRLETEAEDVLDYTRTTRARAFNALGVDRAEQAAALTGCRCEAGVYSCTCGKGVKW